MNDLISIVELPNEFGLDPDEALAVAKRRPADLPVWVRAPGWKYTFFTESILGVDEQGRDVLARSNRLDAVLRGPTRLHPHFLVGFRDEAIITQGAAGLNPMPVDRESVAAIWEFEPPLRITRTDLLVQRVDVQRWQAAVEARRRGGGRVSELRLALDAALAGAPDFRLTTQDAAERVGVSYNTMRARRKASEALDFPRPWASINPDAKRPTFRWLDNTIALRSWMELLKLVPSKSETPAPRPAKRRRARGPRPTSASTRPRRVDAEQLLDDLLADRS